MQDWILTSQVPQPTCFWKWCHFGTLLANSTELKDQIMKMMSRYLERRKLEPDRKRDKVSFPIQRLAAVDQQRVCFCFCLTLKLMRDYLKIINSYVMRNLMNLVYCQRLCFLCDIAELLKITLNFIFMESLRRICLGLL